MSAGPGPMMPAAQGGGYPAQPSSNPALVGALTQPGYLQGVAGYTAPTANYDPAKWYKASGGGNASWQNANYNPAAIGQLNPALLQALGVGSTLGELQQSMVPQSTQAENSLQQQLAEFGVGGGQAIQANDQLQGQLAASIAPAMASAIQNAQANMLGAGQFDVGQANQMGLANAQNAYQAALANSQGRLGAQEFNIGNRQQLHEFNAGNRNQMGQFNAQNALQAALANAGFAQNAGQFNANNQNQMNQYNVGIQNQYQQDMLNAILGNYNAQMGQEGNILGQGQSAGNQQALNYGQDITTNNPMSWLSPLIGGAATFFGGPMAGAAAGSMFGGGNPATGSSYQQYGTP